MWRTFLAVSLYLDGFKLLGAAEPVVHLPIGSLVGRERETATGYKFYSYQNIPFAEPPVGPLRFLAPIEKKPWENTLDATKYRSLCYQVSRSFILETEDCLNINVYTPEGPSTNRSLPVMFWIYGGAFLDGAASEIIYGPDHLVSKDVVVVEANYRLGAFGFLSTGDTVIPGNAGLKDQVLALQWTQKYIEYFGGDPRRVTIFGQSAGAASVSYHLLNPLCTDLFNAAIAQSGSALATWALNRNQIKISYDVAKVISEEEFSSINSSSEALLKYLQGVPAAEIKAAAGNLMDPNLIRDAFNFGPVIEVEHDNAFITERQYETLKRGNFCHVPTIVGFNSKEEIELVTSPDFRTNINLTEDDPESLIPLGMNVKPELKEEVAELIYDHYSPNETFMENPRNLGDFIDDNWFTRPIHKEAQLRSKYGNVWLYKFSFKGAMTNMVTAPVLGFSSDVAHGEELSYLFAIKVDTHNTTDVSTYSEYDILTHQRLVTLWTNFAKYNDPTPYTDVLFQNIRWPRFDNCREKYLDMGSELEVKRFPEKENIQFWEELYKEYGRPPFDTY